jgi:hypothetical protein
MPTTPFSAKHVAITAAALGAYVHLLQNEHSPAEYYTLKASTNAVYVSMIANEVSKFYLVRSELPSIRIALIVF